MAEQEFLLRCFYAVVYQVSIEIAREDLSMPSVAIRRFRQNYSWFTILVNRLHMQAFHKRHKLNYEVDDSILEINPHNTIAEEDADPKWFCVRKLKALFNNVTEELSGVGPRDPRCILLDYVSRYVENCVENPVGYTVRVTYPDYYLELDNLDIKGLSRILAMCSYRERCREARAQGLSTEGLKPVLSSRELERAQRQALLAVDHEMF